MQARPSFYREVHKGIRSFLLDLVVESGRTEWNDPRSLSTLRQRTEGIFKLLSSHAHHEDESVTPLLEKAAPQIAKILGGNHRDQETALDDLLAQLRDIDSSSPDAPLKGHAFTVALSRFAGDSLVHMADEEEVAMTAMWNAFDDPTILEAHDRLVKGIAPQEMAAFLRWMLPAMNDAERAGMLSGVRASAPEPVFAAIRGLAAEVLTPEQNASLEVALGEVQVA